MRRNLSLVLLGAALGGAGACNWTEFDTLADTTWVHSQEKPGNVDSANWAIGLVEAGDATSASGARVGVLGFSKPTYAVVDYGASGGATVAGSSVVKLENAVGISQFLDPPLFGGDPRSASVAVVSPSGNNTFIVAVTDPSTGNLGASILGVPDQPTGLAYARPTAGETAVAVSAKQTVYGFQAKNGPTPKACALGFDLAGLAAVPTTGDVDVIVAIGRDGKLSVYDGTVAYADCNDAAPAPAPRASGLDLGFVPDPTARLFVAVEGSLVIVAMAGEAGKLAVVDVADPAAPALRGAAPTSVVGLKSLAAATIGGKRYVAVGVPARAIDGITAGVVDVYELGATGLSALPVATLHDAQPEANDQSFGRGVAFVPYNGGAALAVAAQNELFFYYQTSFYANLRTP